MIRVSGHDIIHISAQLRAYMNDVMARHSNHAALNSNQGMLPFARLNEAEAAAEKE